MGLENKCDISPSNCVYTSCYCEENVWKLCERIKEEQVLDLEEHYVVFISNSNRQIPLWMQKKASSPLDAVVWDYHVILIRKTKDKSFVYDLDSILPFPCPSELYLEQAIQSDRKLKKQFHRKFRIIPAPVFLQTFASDRPHMRKQNGEWRQPPPAYPPIRTGG
ncbi:predicted protein [Nematostella vectensis]|uniref:Protein N-terminal glutamine amidohydrolase n=1 Tax=Nematostella vectensis TaxID=45351 RepID=A7SNB5_NEMVE|nr:predicted protein [Nematostella vectensis]|eukprot:XP_001626904.1 predicted protein [Nematostella vectensis]